MCAIICIHYYKYTLQSNFNISVLPIYKYTLQPNYKKGTPCLFCVSVLLLVYMNNIL